MSDQVATHSFKVGEATITVRQEIGWDTSDSRIVWRKLIAAKVVDPNSELDSERAWGDYLPAVVQTVSVEGDLGFPWATAASSAAELAAAYLEFGQRARLVSGYRVALRDVETLTPGGEDTTPAKKGKADSAK